MKQQIARLSLHQNSKVFAVLTAIFSLIFVLLLLLLGSLSDRGSRMSFSSFMLLVPVFYLVFGYVAMVITCLIYNFMFRFIGGIEFEARSPDTDA